MDIELLKRIEKANSTDQLIQLVNEFKSAGLTQIQIYGIFETYRRHLRKVNCEAEEDQVLDLLDIIAGWCSPHMKLYERPLSNEEIEAYKSTIKE